MHEYIMALKECLLAELEPADRTSGITASGEGYNELWTWDKLHKTVHAQYAAALLKG
jgi:hypothetical protein